MKLNRARHLLVITIIVVCIAYLLSACDSNVRGAYLVRADLSGADLSQADLYRAKLSGAKLSQANLYRANLRNANLSEARLRGADLTDANLSGVVWNDETVFPEGFEILDELRG